MAFSQQNSLSSATNTAVASWIAAEDINITTQEQYKNNLEGDYTIAGISAYRNKESSSNYFTMLLAKIKL